MSQGLSLPDPTPQAPTSAQRFRSAAEVVKASGLPAPLADAVLTVARRSRLWRREKVEVARELCGHFAEGVSRGETAEELLGSFGELKRASRMITRAKKRNRPLWWKATRDARRAAWVGLAVLVVWYGYHAARFYWGRPVVRFSVLSKINEPALAVPVAQRAWPIYRDAWFAMPGPPVDQHGWSADIEATDKADSPNVAGAMAFAEGARPQLAAIRRAASMARSAYVVHGLGGDAKKEEVYRGEEQLGGDPSAFGMMLPQLAVYRTMGRALAYDALRSARDGEKGTAAADIRAMVGLAQHSAEDGTLIAQLVGVGILGKASETCRHLVTWTPGALSEADLVDLMHALSAYRLNASSAERLDTTVSRLGFEDLLQRVYTDDGRGNGHLTASYFSFQNGTPERVSGLESWAAPALAGVVADRKAMKAAYERVMEAVEAQLSRPLYARSQKDVSARFAEVRGGLFGGGGASLVGELTSSDLAGQRKIDQTLMMRDATVAGLACELFKRRTGRYPSGWSELVPGYLPAAPVDRWTGRALGYRADAGALDAGRPLIYSAGQDGVDGGGVVTLLPGTDIWQTTDWALWPQLPPPSYTGAAGGMAAGFGWSWGGAFWGR